MVAEILSRVCGAAWDERHACGRNAGVYNLQTGAGGAVNMRLSVIWKSPLLDRRSSLILMTNFEIRSATEQDVPVILNLIRELAEYEREPDAVVATEAGLREVL